MISNLASAAEQGGCFVLRPHAPVTAAEVFGIFFLVSAPIIAVGWVSGEIGCWYVLPVSTSVSAAVGAGLWVGYRRTQLEEVVSVDGDSVAIDKGDRKHHRRPQHFEFQRGWAQVILQQAGAGADRFSHLFIRSHGREVEVGAFLDDRERELLASWLRPLMGPTRVMTPALLA